MKRVIINKKTGEYLGEIKTGGGNQLDIVIEDQSGKDIISQIIKADEAEYKKLKKSKQK